MKTKKIFVYGTLKENFCNNQHYIKQFNGKIMGKAKLYGYSMYVDYGIPFITKTKGGEVFGEVFEFKIKDYEELIVPLDNLEGMYNRTNAFVFIDNGVEVEVEVYTIPSIQKGMKLIETGVYN